VGVQDIRNLRMGPIGYPETPVKKIATTPSVIILKSAVHNYFVVEA